MVLPVWAAIVGVSLAKKALFLAAAKLYGIPRLYRKTQQLARWSCQDPATRRFFAARIGKAYRYPGSVAARIFGPGPTMAKSLHKPAHKSSLLPSPKQSVQSAGLSRQSFASSALKRVPSSRLLQRTLQSSQHYLQNLRGASVPGLAQQAGLQNRNIGELSPKAALAHLRRPFNYVLGQSMSLAF